MKTIIVGLEARVTRSYIHNLERMMIYGLDRMKEHNMIDQVKRLAEQ